MYRPLRPALLLLLLVSRFTVADTLTLSPADNLQQLGETAAERGIPILLMVSQYHCGYCERMKNEILNPMLLSGEYEGRVLMRELSIDPGEQVINFQGLPESAESFSHGYKAYVTPTLLFLDGSGQEAVERIRGINTIDYLPLYIEDAIDNATRAMRR